MSIIIKDLEKFHESLTANLNCRAEKESVRMSDDDWLVGWLVSGAPTFVIWHHSLIKVLILVSSAKVKAFYGIANKVN